MVYIVKNAAGVRHINAGGWTTKTVREKSTGQIFQVLKAAGDNEYYLKPKESYAAGSIVSNFKLADNYELLPTE